MMGRLISIGYDNNINMDKVISIVNAGSAPIKRLVRNARDEDMVVDATEGSKTASVIVMESGHIVLSSISSETLRKRANT